MRASAGMAAAILSCEALDLMSVAPVSSASVTSLRDATRHFLATIAAMLKRLGSGLDARL